MRTLPFRQVHLDFHTSPLIPDVGGQFDEKEFVETLKRAEVNSVTLFAKCHHGLSYYNTRVGTRHPNLRVDLLERQYAACKEAGIAAPIYISVGWDELFATSNPGCIAERADGSYHHVTAEGAGWRDLDLASHYMDYLCDQIEEVVTLFPDLDGLFLDIIKFVDNYSKAATARMIGSGLDPKDSDDRATYLRGVLRQYFQRSARAATTGATTPALFHNRGVVRFGDPDFLANNGHVEIEALPTAGWGYDYFSMAAAYATNLELDHLGMTGKFHNAWGDMGGYKHPDALRFESFWMNAYGAKCSIGDHLPPSGRIDKATYEIIGAAFAEVKEREPWIVNSESLATIAFLPVDAVEHFSSDTLSDVITPSDVGVTRVLMESQLPFDTVDLGMDWSRYKLVILPDQIRCTPEIADKIAEFAGQGGKVLLSGDSGLQSDGSDFALDVGARLASTERSTADYVDADAALRPSFADTVFGMYSGAYRIVATDGHSLGKVVLPYFDRSAEAFSGHQNTPANADASKFDCGVSKGNLLYLAHPVFSAYAESGALAIKEYTENVIQWLMKSDLPVVSDLPTGARITLRDQPASNRAVLYLHYALPQLRGHYRDVPIEILQELPTLRPAIISLRLDRKVQTVRLQPQGETLPFQINRETGRIEFETPLVEGYQMIEMTYAY